MAKLLDKVIVVDVESTCWKGKPPAHQVSEIVEIGICVLDTKTRERQERQRIVVKPRYSNVSEFCRELTGLTQEVVEQGIAFSEACEILKTKHRSGLRTWASYGDYDRRQFQRQCEREAVPYPFGVTHVNVKNLFALKYGIGREVGMSQALSMLGIPLVGRHHSAVDDAYNIAAILAWIIK